MATVQVLPCTLSWWFEECLLSLELGLDQVEAEQSIVDSWSVPQKLGVSHGKWTILTLLETFGQGSTTV